MIFLIQYYFNFLFSILSISFYIITGDIYDQYYIYINVCILARIDQVLKNRIRKLFKTIIFKGVRK